MTNKIKPVKPNTRKAITMKISLLIIIIALISIFVFDTSSVSIGLLIISFAVRILAELFDN